LGAVGVGVGLTCFLLLLLLFFFFRGEEGSLRKSHKCGEGTAKGEGLYQVKELLQTVSLGCIECKEREVGWGLRRGSY
jgi:hypothetical protein